MCRYAEAWAMRVVPVTLRYPAFVDLEKMGGAVQVECSSVDPQLVKAPGRLKAPGSL